MEHLADLIGSVPHELIHSSLFFINISYNIGSKNSSINYL